MLQQGVETKAGSSLEGRLDIMWHDDLDGQVHEQPVLLFDDRSWVNLDFAGDFPYELFKRQVSVTGALEDGQFSVFDYDLLSAEPIDSTPIAFDIIQTDQKLAVLIVSLQGNASPFDENEMKNAFFGTGRSTSEFYQEGSRGLVKLIGVEDPTGDVYTVSVSASGCNPDYATVGDQARQAAESQGVPVSSYDKIVYYLPPNASGCPGGGVGGGDAAFIFGVGINGAWDYGAHEVGHTFGLPHAGSYTDCTSGDSPVVYGGSCGHDEYGDLTDIQGGRNFMFSSFHLETLGWLPAENVLVLEESARVVLAPITIPSSTIQSLRIPRDNGSGDTATYHVEFRQPIGFDDGLETGLTNGVLIRQTVSNPLQPRTTHILDMTPGSSNQDFIDAALAQGRSFQDDNILIEVVEVTSETATIDVTLDAMPPDTGNPVGVGGTNSSGGASGGDDTTTASTTGAATTTGGGGMASTDTGGVTTTSGASTTSATGGTSSATVGAGGASTTTTTTTTSTTGTTSPTTTGSVGVGGSSASTTGGITDTPTAVTPAPVDDGGCGCRLGATRTPGVPLVAGMLLLGAAALRRRRYE